ncbi:VanW family protein [Inediibacterium massiliense]|uniref:VanW family protein n=1 Tax=Inediibacterium massiliense TaxID=1658111 RepID=UPI0006B50627|nr:VanW family protein [Inediibacterium massiliense]
MSENIKSKEKKLKLGTGLIIVLLSFLLSITAIGFFLLYQDTIYDGVNIENLDVGGISIMEAQEKARNHFDTIGIDGKICFSYGDKNWEVSSKDIGYTYDYTKAVQEAYQVGREGSYFERLQTILSLYKNPYSISLKPIYDHEKMNQFIDTIENEINKKEKDATITRSGGRFHITNEVVGLQLDVKKTQQLVGESLKNTKLKEDIYIQLSVSSISPKVSAESLSTIQDVLGEYETTFNASNASRSENIRLSAKSINGTVLMPTEVFSFNDVVGPRSKEKGYQGATVIFEGEFVEGLGGGVCQTSSTLYNAVLLSNLDTVQRVKHTIPSTYVPKGRDATVSYGVLDFKFKNSTANPVYIESYVGGNKVKFRIYGHKADSRRVEIQSIENEVIKRPIEVKYDSTLAEGKERIEQKGRDGYKVSTYKIVCENGKEIERKQISNDYYKPKTQVVVKGTKKATPSNSVKTQKKEDHKETNIPSHDQTIY